MSISAVARAADLSVSTVSRYLRGELRVNPDTEARILGAMEHTGFESPRLGLRRLALIVPELANPYFSQLAQAIADATASRGLGLQVLVSNGLASRETALMAECAASPEVDGVMLVSMTGRASPLHSLPGDFPVVILDERIHDESSRPFVGVDNFGGAYQATSYLLSRGHTSIVHAAGPSTLDSARDRLEGYRTALRDRGIEADPNLIIEGPYAEAFGESVLTRLLRLDDAPTAVFCGSDIVAIGMIAAAPMYGVSIPRDLSLVGFDGIPQGEWVTPRLTTVTQPIEALARRVLETIESGPTSGQAAEVRLPMQIRVAGSVAPPPTR